MHDPDCTCALCLEQSRREETEYDDATCSRCGGEGFIMICPDDMCRGAGECIHGDGEIVCPYCKGDGEV